MYIWTILGVVALILLVIYWNSRNAVWGGLTLGIISGFIWKLVGKTDWYIVIKTMTVGILLGFLVELLGMISNYLKRNTK